jgi:hypothetical protein
MLVVMLSTMPDQLESSCTDLAETREWKKGDTDECVKVIQQVVGKNAHKWATVEYR